MNPIESPIRQPALFEVLLNLSELEVINRALADYTTQDMGIGELDEVYDLLQGFSAAYAALRMDTERQIAEML